MTALADAADALLLDLDGTVYLGGQVIPYVVDALTEATNRGARPMFVTNNASRPPAEVAAALTGMGVPATPADVLTSPEAAAAMLAETHPAGSKVLVVGAPALVDAVADVGLSPVRLATDEPVAVVQGHSPDTGWRNLAEACIAIRSGVDWVASNTDATLPTDRGLLPGNGAMVQALIAATGRTPRVAGKPNRPLLDEAVRRAGASRPLVVGDRLDTDIEAAVLAGLPSLMVLTGVSTAADLLAAPESRRPTHVAFDLRGLVDDALAADIQAIGDYPGLTWTVQPDGSDLVLSGGSDKEDNGHQDTDGAGPGDTDRAADAQHLLALALLAATAWKCGLTAVRATGAAATAAVARLQLVGPDRS